MKPSAIIIGIAAGFAAALLFAGVVVQSALAIVLSLAAPLPIFIASLGWGSAVGFLAAATAGLALGTITGSPSGGILLFASIALPAAVVGHVAGLARPSESAPPPGGRQGALDWFPVSRILLAIAVVSSAACLFVGWLIGYDSAAIGDELATALSSQVGGDAAAQDQLAGFARQIVGIIPFLQPALFVVVLVVCLYVSAGVTRASGKLARPRDDIPTVAGVLPKTALPVFALALAASFASGVVGNVGAVVAGSFGMAFTLAGLATIHRATRRTRSRSLILFALYMGIFILTFPLAIATVLGLAETAKRQAPSAPSA